MFFMDGNFTFSRLPSVKKGHIIISAEQTALRFLRAATPRNFVKTVENNRFYEIQTL